MNTIKPRKLAGINKKPVFKISHLFLALMGKILNMPEIQIEYLENLKILKIGLI